MMVKGWQRPLFTFLLTAFAGVTLYSSLDLSRTARLVPITVVVPTLVFLLIQLVLDLSPRLARMWSRIELNTFLTGQAYRVSAQTGGEMAATVAAAFDQRHRHPHKIILWVVTMLALVYLSGLVVALPLYTLLFTKIRSRERWPVSLAMAAGVWVLTYGVFAVALGTPLRGGQIWVWLGF